MSDTDNVIVEFHAKTEGVAAHVEQMMEDAPADRVLRVAIGAQLVSVVGKNKGKRCVCTEVRL